MPVLVRGPLLFGARSTVPPSVRPVRSSPVRAPPVHSTASISDAQTPEEPGRRVVLVLVTVLAVAVAVAGPFASASTALAKTRTCTLFTKKQASKALGFAVVERVRSTEQATGAEECEYRTEKYWSPDLEELDAMRLVVAKLTATR